MEFWCELVCSGCYERNGNPNRGWLWPCLTTVQTADVEPAGLYILFTPWHAGLPASGPDWYVAF